MVNVILITHEAIGRVLLDTVTTVLGGILPLPTRVIAINYHVEPEKMMDKLDYWVDRDKKNANAEDFLVLTDLFGATPCNIASHLRVSHPNDNIGIVTGLNLPMLIRVMNYAALPLTDLIQKAASGGKDGIVTC